MSHRAAKGSVVGTDHADDNAPEKEVPSDVQARAAAATFAMLADPTRLKLLWLLGRDEFDVATLAGRAGTTPSVASQHLAKLRLAGLVRQRVDGRRRLYTASGTHLKALIREALYRADHDVTGVPDHG
jgi:DNA-binding transcriptional ArsR family regulator